MPAKQLAFGFLTAGFVIVLAILAGKSVLSHQGGGSVSPGPASQSQLDRFDITGLRSRIGGNWPTDETLQAIAAQESLESLDLSGCSFSQNQYQWLADLRALRVLSLRDSFITDVGFVHLERLLDLQELDLGGTRITDKSLPAIGSMTRLRKLDLDGFGSKLGISARGLEHLASLKELRVLSLEVEGTDEEMRVVSSLLGLEKLRLTTRRLTEQRMGSLTALQNLRHLSVSVSSIFSESKREPSAPIGPPLKLPRLEALRLMHVPVNDEWAAQLGVLPMLQHLSVSGPVQLTDAGVRDICRRKTLRSLELSSVKGLTNRGVEYFATLKDLQELCLCSSELIDDSTASYIARMRGLRRLKLSGTRIGDAGLRQLSVLKGLEHLDISSTSGTDACVEDLAKLSHLRELWIVGTSIGPAGLESLRKALPNCSVVSKVGTVGPIGGQYQDEDDECKTTSGTLVGTLTGKGDAWIEIKTDGEKPWRYVPNWIGGAPKNGGGWDKSMVQTINNLKVGARIRVEWRYEQRRRLVKVAVLP